MARAKGCRGHKCVCVCVWVCGMWVTVLKAHMYSPLSKRICSVPCGGTCMSERGGDGGDMYTPSGAQPALRDGCVVDGRPRSVSPWMCLWLFSSASACQCLWSVVPVPDQTSRKTLRSASQGRRTRGQRKHKHGTGMPRRACPLWVP
ncbi:hypothetical protein B0H63DRAFT_57668 [Podospora didyma]|uniref:Uncharacterized protein n=1 Tax=Podospora didyma TaxID=330526 RepID=A0AAE0P7K2_9PEZI|nr:hypothetical protein B0H63DRAFT_57668 [Podospora didyma]